MFGFWRRKPDRAAIVAGIVPQVETSIGTHTYIRQDYPEPQPFARRERRDEFAPPLAL